MRTFSRHVMTTVIWSSSHLKVYNAFACFAFYCFYCSLVFVQFSCNLISTKSYLPSIISVCRICVWRTWNMTCEESFNGTWGRANHYRSVRIWEEVLVPKTGVVHKLQTNVFVVRVIKLCCVNSYFTVQFVFGRTTQWPGVAVAARLAVSECCR